jgi:flagellar protein FlbT
MALKIDLKPLEQILLGPVASVISNSDQRTTLYILGDVPILREKDVMHEDEADTPCKKVYFLVQSMYMASNPKTYFDRYFALTRDIQNAAPSTTAFFLKINETIDDGSYYKALKVARQLIKHEEELIRDT